MFGNMGDMMKLMGQMGRLKEIAAEAQERARNRTVNGEAGAGLVKVVANGMGEVLQVTIDPEALKEPDTLGPLIAAAVNQAITKAKQILIEEGQAAMGIQLPPGLL
jgi:hypothetical protein